MVWFRSSLAQQPQELESLRLMFMTVKHGYSTDQDKAGRLVYSEGLMTHAMVLTGVGLDKNGKINQVES